MITRLLGLRALEDVELVAAPQTFGVEAIVRRAFKPAEAVAGIDPMEALDGQRVGLRRRVGLGGLRREPQTLDDDEVCGVGQHPLGGGPRGAGERAPEEVDARRHRAAITDP